MLSLKMFKSKTERFADGQEVIIVRPTYPHSAEDYERIGLPNLTYMPPRVRIGMIATIRRSWARGKSFNYFIAGCVASWAHECFAAVSNK